MGVTLLCPQTPGEAVGRPRGHVHSGKVKVERAVDHAPEWMQAQIDQAAAETAQEPAPPAAPAKAGKQPKTVH